MACLSVCLLVTFVSPAETVEPIEMPFGADSDGPGNHVLDGGPDLHGEWAICVGLSAPLKSRNFNGVLL